MPPKNKDNSCTGRNKYFILDDTFNLSTRMSNQSNYWHFKLRANRKEWSLTNDFSLLFICFFMSASSLGRNAFQLRNNTELEPNWTQLKNTSSDEILQMTSLQPLISFFVSTCWQVCFSMFSSNNHLVSQLFLHGSQRTRRADGLKEPVSVYYYIVVMNRG